MHKNLKQGIDAIQYDKNLQQAKLKGNWEWLSPAKPPFSINGLFGFETDGKYLRFPEGIATQLPEAVARLSGCPAGGQIRFRTNAHRLAIYVQMEGVATMDHMPATGQCGFDVYMGEAGEQKYITTCKPGLNNLEYEHLIWDKNPEVVGTSLNRDEYQTVTLNFPLYQGVRDVRIGVDPGADVAPPIPYQSNKRVLFYGTSVTQGGCASRPGLAYTNILSRRLPIEFMNLGFSGSGKGEKEVAIAVRNITRPACLVLDYEGNCTTELYKKTLEPFTKIYREYHPDVPILVMSRIPYAQDILQTERQSEWNIRRQFASACVDSLRDAGDKWLRFIDGSQLLGRHFNECTVDGIHPNDLGFMYMADALEPIMRKALNEKNIL